MTPAFRTFGLAAAVVGVGIALLAARADEAGALTEALPQMKEWEAALQKSVEGVRRQEPFEQAVASLAKQANVPITCDQAGLLRAEVDLKQPIAKTIRGLSFKATLNKLLQPMSLTAVLSEGGLQITDAESVKCPPVLRVYPVFDLVHRKDPKVADGATELIKFLRTTVRPQEWKNPNAGATIRFYAPSSTLVVDAAPETQDEMERSLKGLRSLLQFHGVKLMEDDTSGKPGR